MVAMLGRSAVLLACTLGACASDPDPAPGDDPPPTAACPDAEYADGRCHIDLACGLPDIDCFVRFPTDSDAANWAAPRTGLAPIFPFQPAFARARMLADRAWEMFRAEVPLGDVGDLRLSVVLLDDFAINAYVMTDGEPGKVGFAVLLTTGMLRSAMTDDEIIGVMLHELAHLVKHHALHEVQQLNRRFYVARGGTEPIGALQPEDPDATGSGKVWRALAEFVGTESDPGYLDFPINGTLANLYDQYAWSVVNRMPQCGDAVFAVQAVRNAWPRSPLDAIVPIKAEPSADAAAVLANLKACVATDTYKLSDVVGALGPVWIDYVQTELSPNERRLLDARALDGILELILTRRKAQRNAEYTFTAQTGEPWTALRFYSYEEEADDYSFHIGRAHGLTGVGIVATMRQVLGSAYPACEALLESGADVPYGKNLLDDHHAPCWRIQHARQVLAATRVAVRSLAPVVAPAPTPWVPTRRDVPRLLD